jgi:hypothetical protein
MLEGRENAPNMRLHVALELEFSFCCKSVLVSLCMSERQRMYIGKICAILFITHPVVPSIMLGLSDFLYHESKPNVVVCHIVFISL